VEVKLLPSVLAEPCVGEEGRKEVVEVVEAVDVGATEGKQEGEVDEGQ
jgi:hypothetical protein